MKINIKPFSVNNAWQGRRFKTNDYNKYIIDIIKLLKPLKVPSGKLCLNIVFGFSNASADIDNGLKPFIDILQKKYRFNDNKIYRLVIDKKVVKKGSEFIDFKITKWDHLD
jgi:Holliday junction resolvase RusA-like endonuclease